MRHATRIACWETFLGRRSDESRASQHIHLQSFLYARSSFGASGARPCGSDGRNVKIYR